VVKVDGNDCYDNYKKISNTINGWKDEFEPDQPGAASIPGRGNVLAVSVPILLASLRF